VRIQTAGQGAGGERFQSIAETRAARVRRSDRRQLLRVENRHTVDQYDVAAHAQTRSARRGTHGMVKSLPVSHQRGGGHDSASVSLDDGAIDAGSEAKVIGVDDQTAHRVSLAGARISSQTGEIAPSTPNNFPGNDNHSPAKSLSSIRFVRFWRKQKLKPEIAQEIGLVAAGRFEAASDHEEKDQGAMNFIASPKVDGGLAL